MHLVDPLGQIGATLEGRWRVVHQLAHPHVHNQAGIEAHCNQPAHLLRGSPTTMCPT